MESAFFPDGFPQSGEGDGSDVNGPGSWWRDVHGRGLRGTWCAGCGASWGDEVKGVFLPVDAWVIVSKPRNSKDEGVVSELCNESRHLFPVSVDVQAHLGHVGNVCRVDRSTVDNLETAGVPKGVQWEVVLLREVLVDKGKPGGTAVDQ